MGVCSQSQLSVSLIFCLCPRFFNATSKKQRYRLDFSMKSICEDIRGSLACNYIKKNYKIQLKFRGKIYTSQDHITLFELTAKNNEKITVLVVPKDKNRHSLSIKIYCCGENSTIIQVPQNYSVCDLKLESIRAKSCCDKTECKVIINYLEIFEDDPIEKVDKESIHVVFENSKLSYALSP